MFILYAVVIGLGVGLLLRGRVGGLARLQFHLGGLILAALLVQVALFSEPVTQRIGDLGAPIYVYTTTAVLLVVVMNSAIRGLPIVAAGAACNLAAIIANGGYMPADRAALASLGRGLDGTYSNSALVAHPALQPLTDIFALPRWLPFANIFSVGDVLIGVGVVAVIVIAMRAQQPAATNPDVPEPADLRRAALGAGQHPAA